MRDTFAMTNKSLIGAVIIILIGAAVWYYTSGAKEESAQVSGASYTMGTYAYQCADGSQFSMSPSDDMSEIRLEPGAGASFEAAALSRMGEGNVFETVFVEGENITFSGNGETVTLLVGEKETTCTPVPSTDSPPFNFGDPLQ